MADLEICDFSQVGNRHRRPVIWTAYYTVVHRIHAAAVADTGEHVGGKLGMHSAMKLD